MGSQEPCSKCDSDDKGHHCHGCGRCSECCPDWEGHGRGGYMESTDAALDKAFHTGWSVIKFDEDEQEHLMTQMPRPHSNRVDCANCDNYPMDKIALRATGGVEPYYRCSRCGNTVRVAG